MNDKSTFMENLKFKDAKWQGPKIHPLVGVLIIVGYYFVSAIVSILLAGLQYGYPDNNLLQVLNHPNNLFFITLIYGLILLLIFRHYNIKLFNTGEGKDVNFVLKGVIFGIILFVGNALLGYLALMLNPDFNTANEALLETILVNLAPWSLLGNIGILTPIIEEVLFRGVLMKIVFKNRPVLGMWVSTAVFAMIHVPTDLMSLLIYGWLGFLLAYAYNQTRRLEVPIIMHIINNSIAVLPYIL